MSDQPKLTTGEKLNRVIKIGGTGPVKVIPTTGEWTAQDVYRIIRDAGDGANHALSNAHNAALAAERERFRQMEQMLSRSFDKVQAQLAAERERSTKLDEDMVHYAGLAEEYRDERDEAIRLLEYKDKQLAAAQALLRSMPRSFGINENDIGDTAALDAAVAAAQKPLVDALKGMLSVYEELHARYDLGECQATVDSRTALAKVKDGKMSDQPKPTTGAFKCEKCGAALGWCEPVLCDKCQLAAELGCTSDEWTVIGSSVSYEDMRWLCVNPHQAKSIADAHNAAMRNAQPFLDDALKQLAAERERSKRLDEDMVHYAELAEKYREQLASEQELVADAAGQILTKQLELDEAIRLLEYKSAAQKPLVDALKDCLAAIRHEDYSSQLSACIKGDAALAKAKVVK